MASRYWVGGGGIWDDTDTSHWSATSGGSGGASCPTSADHVTFDANSGTGDVYGSGMRYCISFTSSGSALASVSASVTCSGGITCPGSADLSGMSFYTTGNLNINLYGKFINRLYIGGGCRSTLLSIVNCNELSLGFNGEISWSPSLTMPFGAVLTVPSGLGYIHSSTAGTRAKLSAGSSSLVILSNIQAYDIEFVSPPTTWYIGPGSVDGGNNLNWNVMRKRSQFFSMTP